MNQILLFPDEVGDGGRVVLEGRRARHVRDILRAEAGSHVRVGVLNGPRGQGQLCEVALDRVELVCRFDLPALPPTGIRLLLALPRPKVMHRLFAPLAAFGVEEVILTNAAKVERSYFDTHWLEPDAYRPLLLEGLEQSGETRLPQVRVVRRLKPFVEDELGRVPAEGQRLLLHPQPTASLSEAPLRSPVLAAVGPEGGWTDYEIALFREHGFTCVSLGPRVLRTDIAVSALLGVLQVRLPH